jgi:hypothetical protein
MVKMVSVFFFLTVVGTYSLTVVPTPVYANCFSEPPRGTAPGHRSGVGSAGAKTCSPARHCAVDESTADRCFVRDRAGKFMLEDGKRVRISWIFDMKLGDYRPRRESDDLLVAQECDGRQISAGAFASSNRVMFKSGSCDSPSKESPAQKPGSQVFGLDPTQDPSSPLYQGRSAFGR